MYEKHGKTNTRLYSIWNHMKSRCKNLHLYHRYEHIEVCEEWKNSFTAFERWSLESGYEAHLTIDRIDTEGNYEPYNCRWATKTVQAENKKLQKNKTGYTGIEIRGKKFKASIQHNGKKHYLGNYDTVEEAIKVRNGYISRHNTSHRANTLSNKDTCIRSEDFQI